MLFKDPLHWFPDPYFSTVLVLFIFGVFFIEYIVVPRAIARVGSDHPILVRDRSSITVIGFIGIVAIIAALVFRYLNITVAPDVVQYIGLGLIPIGLAVREWAIIKLGHFFTRTVQIKPDHQLITNGPYRWIRHPAYTGMLLIDLGIALALGTWIGGMLTLVLVLGATMYRVFIEEKVLIETFGDVYLDYIKHSWKLFPGL